MSESARPPVSVRVLAVVSDQRLAALIETVFREAGDEVLVLGDLNAGVGAAETIPPDVAFVDVDLKQRGGLALVHHLKALATDVDIYAIATKESLDIAAQAVSLGAVGLILSPPGGDELLAAATAARGKKASALALRERERERGADAAVLAIAGRLAAATAATSLDAACREVMEAFGLLAADLVLYVSPLGGTAELRRAGFSPGVDDAPSFAQEMELLHYGQERGLEVLSLVTGRLSVGLLLYGGADRRLAQSPYLSLFAAQATAALGLAREHEQGDRATIKDPETSAYSFAYFVDVAGREIDKANRYGRRFALATVAHVGDEPMGPLEVAEKVLAVTRDSDVLARIDEREFYLLLPETGGIGAHACRRRVTAVVDSQGPDSAARRARAGFHIGVATYPQDGVDLTRLLRVAKRRADACDASVVHRMRLDRLALPDLVDALLWDTDIAQGKGDPAPESPRALELPMVDVLGLVSSLLVAATRAGKPTIVVSARDGLGLASGVRSQLGGQTEATVHVLDVRAREGCENLEVLVVIGEHGAYALLGRHDHGMFQGVHASDPLLADLAGTRLGELAGVRVLE